MPIDHIGSMVNLARQRLMDLDLKTLKTEIGTHELKVLLETLISLGTPEAPKIMDAEARKTVAERIARFTPAS